MKPKPADYNRPFNPYVPGQPVTSGPFRLYQTYNYRIYRETKRGNLLTRVVRIRVVEIRKMPPFPPFNGCFTAIGQSVRGGCSFWLYAEQVEPG